VLIDSKVVSTVIWRPGVHQRPKGLSTHKLPSILEEGLKHSRPGIMCDNLVEACEKADLTTTRRLASPAAKGSLETKRGIGNGLLISE